MSKESQFWKSEKFWAKIAILALGAYVYWTDQTLGAFIMMFGLLAVILER